MTTPAPSAQTLTVRSAVAPLLGDARASATMVSQLLAGACATVLETRGDWQRVRGEDGYEGWMHAGYLAPSSGGERTWRLSLGCTVRGRDGSVRPLPLGARIAPSDDVLSGDALDADARARRFAPTGAAIASSATTLFAGASYLWGGVTPWGCDCSGLVQRAFALHAVRLPRDAWQQALEGSEHSRDAAAQHTAGDLLFFSDRDDARVTHVGIATGDGRMVHSSLTRGGVAIERMDGDDPYVARLRATCTGIRRVGAG